MEKEAMEPNNMEAEQLSGFEIEAQVVRALLSPSKLKILSALSQRKKMPAELQKELGLAGSTIVEHLQNLENVEIVERIETGRKFVYYELTARGEKLLKFRASIKYLALILLAVPSALRFTPAFGTFSGTRAATAETIAETAKDAALASPAPPGLPPAPPVTPPILPLETAVPIQFILFFAFVAVILVSMFFLIKIWKKS